MTTAIPTITRAPKKILLFVTVAILSLSTGFWFWNEVVKYNVLPKRWGVVEPGRIYRSGQISPRLVERALKKHNIAVIVDLTSHRKPDHAQTAESQAAARLGIEHRSYPLKGDGTGDIRQYAAAIARIHQAVSSNQPVLVHCSAGTQRTGGVIAAYRMLVQGGSPEAALTEMQQFGWRPHRDGVLVDYLNSHMDELAQMLLDRRVISTLPATSPRLKPRSCIGSAMAL